MRTFRELALGEIFILEDKFTFSDGVGGGILMKIENQNNDGFKSVYVTGSNKGKYLCLIPEDKVTPLNYTMAFTHDGMKIIINHVIAS